MKKLTNKFYWFESIHLGNNKNERNNKSKPQKTTLLNHEENTFQKKTKKFNNRELENFQSKIKNAQKICLQNKDWELGSIEMKKFLWA